MARIYSNTRNLLDPSLLQMANAAVNQRIGREAERGAGMVSSIRDILKSGADTLSDWRARNAREDEVSRWDIPGDPIARAAREEYVRTGSSGPLMNYQMQKLAAEQRIVDAQKAADEKAWQKKLHDAVNLREDRNKYAQYQANMFKAMDENRLADAETYRKQMENLENFYSKYYPEYETPFGRTAQAMWDARQNEKIAAEAKRLQEQEDKELEELGARNLKAIQEVNENERLHRVALFKNSLPTTFAKETDKQSVYDKIEANEDMTIPEKTELMNEIRGIESGLTKTKKAKQSARASAAGEGIKEQIKISKETKKKAEEAKKAKEAGYKLTADEQDAYDAVYGGKKAKEAGYKLTADEQDAYDAVYGGK